MNLNRSNFGLEWLRTASERLRNPSIGHSHAGVFQAAWLFVFATSFVFFGCNKSTPTSVLGDATHPALVHVYTVAEETAQRRVQATGSLFPFEESVISAQVEGRISQVLADVGDNVQQGQALIVLDPQELQTEVLDRKSVV